MRGLQTIGLVALSLQGASSAPALRDDMIAAINAQVLVNHMHAIRAQHQLATSSRHLVDVCRHQAGPPRETLASMGLRSTKRGAFSECCPTQHNGANVHLAVRNEPALAKFQMHLTPGRSGRTAFSRFGTKGTAAAVGRSAPPR